MIEQLARLHEEQLIFLSVMAGMVLLSVTVLGVVAAVQMRKLRQKELELGFKDELLLRGYTVDETIRLVASRKPRWSQGLIDVGDRAGRLLGSTTQRVAAAADTAAKRGIRFSRELWQRAAPQLRQACSQAQPWLRAAASRLCCGAAQLGRKADSLLRSLLAPQP